MPEPFVKHRGIAAPLMIDNVDTDQIIPSREMRAVSRKGLGEGLFAGWRYTEPGGRELADAFILNRPPFDAASILVSGENFGCGSSREHAVWALAEFGIRAIVAKGFGAIFADNCVRNGVLPIRLVDDEVRALAEAAAGGAEIEIDLPEQTVTRVGTEQGYRFEIDAFAKRMLVEGLDPIGLTQTRSDEIAAFLEQDRTERPWVYL